MKKRIMSAGLVLVVLISLAACGTSSAASVVEQTSSSVVAESAAESEVEAETNPWFDYEAAHKELEKYGIPYELNADGSLPAEWTPEYYMTEEYADCKEEFPYVSINTMLKYIELNKITDDFSYDNFPSKQLFATAAADFGRHYPEFEPISIEKIESILKTIDDYVIQRGAEEYPYQVNDIYFCKYPSTSTIAISIKFLNNNEKDFGENSWFQGWFSTKDYACQGFYYFSEALDGAYGEGTAKKASEKAVAMAQSKKAQEASSIS